MQAPSSEAAGTAVRQVGGRVTDTLNIINAVGAELTPGQVEALRALPESIRVFANERLTVSGGVSETYYPGLVGAADLHDAGITGVGVTIAVLDTGIWETASTKWSANGKHRIIAQHDATVPTFTAGSSFGTDDDGSDNDDDGSSWLMAVFGSWQQLLDSAPIDDWNGHGTHVSSIALGSGRSESGRYEGIAPNANLVAVRAFEADGSGTYLNVIKALDWIV